MTAETTLGLFLTHQRCDRIERHLERLRAETAGLFPWELVFNGDGLYRPKVSFPYRPASKEIPYRYKDYRRHGGLMGGRLDVLLIPLIVASQADYVWVMEYDVDYSGHWSRFFSQFQASRADLLSTTVVPYEQSREWFYWPSAQPPTEVPQSVWLRAFHPIMRISRRFALWYCEEMKRSDWRGHYEYTLPTSAAWGGFEVEDIGGEGALCPASRRGGNYQNTPDCEFLTPGTFVWRPAWETYFHESPESFEQTDMLYHPVKPDVANWTMPKPTFWSRIKCRWGELLTR